jgi:hypothetical protein
MTEKDVCDIFQVTAFGLSHSINEVTEIILLEQKA